MAKALGGIKKYGRDTPIPLDRVLEVCGLDAALWCLCCVIEPADREIRLLACDFAEHTLSIFEEKYPNNKQPRQVIEVSRKFAEGKATREDLAVAKDAVWTAARDAAWAAAGAVARDILVAAWAARDAAWDAAKDVARDILDAAWAARDATWAAAWDAGRDVALAAWDAENQWQEKKFREMLAKFEEIE